MRSVITALLLFTATAAFSQVRQNVYFLKNNGKQVSVRDSADYIRIIREPDSGSVHYQINEYFANGNPKLAGHTSTISSIKYEGQCVTFHKNGVKSAVLNYKNGQMAGPQFHYFTNGKLQEERNYPETLTDKAALIEGKYMLMNYADSAGNYSVKDGAGAYKFTKRTIVKKKENLWSTEGEIKNGIKQGAWQTSIDNDSIKLVENFNNGKFISGTATFASGEVSNYTEPDQLPEFKGGQAALNRYLSSTLRYPSTAQQQRIQGRVIVNFKVDKDGTVCDIKTLGKVPSEDLAEEAIRVVEKSPKWIPGRQFGRAVKVMYTLPIVFTLR